MTPFLLPLVLALSVTSDDDRLARVMQCYAAGAQATYRDAALASQALVQKVKTLCARPDDRTLADARAAWCEARRAYDRTEVYRFGDGPIDAKRGGVETFVNAWPIDENFIEPATRPASTGIIADRARFPVLARAVIREHNQRGGETNVCTGWHAIEFMLWGRDTSDTGPGERPAGDFIDGAAPDADRRREFLIEITIMLQEDLERVEAQWRDAPGSHRRRFLAAPDRAVRAMFAGPALLAGFELAGERLSVALETRDQEEETSCFSDFSDSDFREDMAGIARVLRGGTPGDGLIDLVRAQDASQAECLQQALDRAMRAVDRVPHPFDAAIRAPDGDARRDALLSMRQALESLSEQISLSAKRLGCTLPSQPTG